MFIYFMSTVRNDEVRVVAAAPQVSPRAAPRRPGGYPAHHDVEQLRRSRSTPLIHTTTGVEELERLQTRAEKSRHDLLPPQLGAR